MPRSLAALFALAVVLVSVPPADAQTPAAASRSADGMAAEAASTHTFQIVDGAVHLDGLVVPDAVPAGLDLTGLSTPPLDYAGPIAPVIEVDGRAYVFEGGRLVPIAESARAANGVYMMGDLVPEPRAMDDVPDNQLALVSQEVYMRDVAVQDRGLWEKLHLERVLETQALQLSEQVRGTPPGPERTQRRSELRDLLSRLFTLKQDIRREEVARAQAELDALRVQLDDRARRHDTIVDGRLRELVDQ